MTETRSPLEILARLAGRSTFVLDVDKGGEDKRQFKRYSRVRVPITIGEKDESVIWVTGPAAVASKRQTYSLNLDRLTDQDIAHALGCAHDKLGSDLAYSIACGSVAYRASILDRAFGRVVAELESGPRPVRLSGDGVGARRVALRHIVASAFGWLVHGDAPDDGMWQGRVSDRLGARLRNVTVATMRDAADSAAWDAMVALFDWRV